MVVTVTSWPLPATVDTVEANPTTTAGVVANSGTHDACTITAVPHARPGLTPRFGGWVQSASIEDGDRCEEPGPNPAKRSAEAVVRVRSDSSLCGGPTPRRAVPERV